MAQLLLIFCVVKTKKVKIYGRSEEEDMEWREKEDAEVSPVGFERRR